ncbi:MAG TPA: hypothetical protein VM077_01255 [Candidatus Limnocylindrales bacterium]|nr:hypothetical protein [Candidatus Limnocylindrales bacterium]
MDTLPFQFITLFANSAILIFVFYYFFKLNAKEKELEKKEGKVDADYHHIVDEALAKERKIIDDATTEAEKIITDTDYASTTDKDQLNLALNKIVEDIKKETAQTGHDLIDHYASTLKVISLHSQENFQDVSKEFEDSLKKQIRDFQDVAKTLETDLQKQIKDFHQSLLPNLQKELEEYKTERIKQTEELVNTITQKAAEEIFNKSISIDDHQKLIIESLEKAKKEGVFS